MQHCDQTCSYCAREFWKWVKGREAQMSTPRKGESFTFNQAAQTSIRAPKNT